MNNTDQPEEQEDTPIPVFDILPPDPRGVSDEQLVYGTLHGLPGYEEEWHRRNYSQEEAEEFDGYDGNY
jgi:hypothetical protein